jgi:hypothetical protein
MFLRFVHNPCFNNMTNILFRIRRARQRSMRMVLFLTLFWRCSATISVKVWADCGRLIGTVLTQSHFRFWPSPRQWYDLMMSFICFPCSFFPLHRSTRAFWSTGRDSLRRLPSECPRSLPSTKNTWRPSKCVEVAERVGHSSKRFYQI